MKARATTAPTKAGAAATRAAYQPSWSAGRTRASSNPTKVQGRRSNAHELADVNPHLARMSNAQLAQRRGPLQRSKQAGGKH